MEVHYRKSLVRVMLHWLLELRAWDRSENLMRVNDKTLEGKKNNNTPRLCLDSPSTSLKCGWWLEEKFKKGTNV